MLAIRQDSQRHGFFLHVCVQCVVDGDCVTCVMYVSACMLGDWYGTVSGCSGHVVCGLHLWRGTVLFPGTDRILASLSPSGTVINTILYTARRTKYCIGLNG
jgi:hypothetical protein